MHGPFPLATFGNHFIFMTCHVLTMAAGIHSIQKLGCVAQLDRALPSGGRGRGFESRRIQFAFSSTFRTCAGMFYGMRTDATTVAEYLQQIPQQWKPLVVATRKLLMASRPYGYDESLRWGMISHEVPLKMSGPTYSRHTVQRIIFFTLFASLSIYIMKGINTQGNPWKMEALPPFPPQGARYGYLRCLHSLGRVDHFMVPLHSLRLA